MKCMKGFLLLMVCTCALGEANFGGLEGNVSSFVEGLNKILKGLGITVMGISIVWAGYKFMFKKGQITECAQIVGGGFLVGGASEIASLILGAFG